MPDDGGRFGRWIEDPDGTPWFELRPPGRAAVLPPGGSGAVWHHVGNGALTATVAAGGWTTLYATARGMVRLTGPRSRWGLASWPGGVPTRARFGPGSVTWQRARGGLTVTRRLAAAPDDVPVARVEVTVEGSRTRADRWEEHWQPEVFPLLVGALMSRWLPPPPGYDRAGRLVWHATYGLSQLSRTITDALRRALGRGRYRPATVAADGRALVVPPRRWAAEAPLDPPTWWDPALPALVVAALEGSGGSGTVGVEAGGAGGVVWAAVPAGEAPVELTFAVGLADGPDDIDRLVAHAGGFTVAGAARRWGRLVVADLPGRPALAREARWHAAALLGARQPDAHLRGRYVAQGSAYGFIHGLQGAPRDYALAAVPLTFVDPVAARETLEVIMRLTRPSGAVHYAHTGRGRATGGGIHASPTDLPIFTLWALTDYVWATGDRGFLDRPVPFWPLAAQRSATPRERVVLAARYLAERVGVGPHGLLRVGSGDWADPISAMVADRRAFHHHGESGFNTAFAVYALPRAAELVADSHPAEAGAMRDLADQLRAAMAGAWTGEWFLRGFDGRGAPVGDRHLFLDGQVWCLIAGIGTDAQRSTLVRSIAQRCDDPSPIGATILDRPHPVRFGMLAPGWDCNGGVWAAINGLLAWGYALHDPARAWRCLEAQGLAAHARAYPGIWYGIWSGPDAYNAHFGHRPGETFVQPATPMAEFPVGNANAHLGPLLGLLRVLGVETDPTGIVVRDRGPGGPERWRLATALGTFGR